MKKLVSLFLVLALLLGAASALAETEGKNVYIVTPYLTSVTTKDMAEYIKGNLEEVGCKVTVIDTEGDTATFASRIEDAVTAKADAIVIISVDPEYCKVQIQEAYEAGIPVFGCDAGYIDTMQMNATSDNYQIGQLITTYLFDKMEHKGNLVVLTHRPHPGVVRRTEALDDMLKDNPDIHDWEALKRDLASLPFVAYAGISVSGLGVFALIPILDPTKHKEHFDSLDRRFADYGLKLDRAPQNISSKRFVSYDPAPVWNTEAEVYEQLVEAPLNSLNPLNSLTPLNPLNSSNPLNSLNSSLEPRPGMLKQMLRNLMMPLSVNDFAPFDLEDFLHRHGIEYEARPRQGGTQYIVHCPWAHLHSSHSYADSALFRYPDGRIGYKCLHDHCADRTWHDFREYYETQ